MMEFNPKELYTGKYGHICIICDELFSSNTEVHKTCSFECKSEYMRRKARFLRQRKLQQVSV